MEDTTELETAVEEVQTVDDMSDTEFDTFMDGEATSEESTDEPETTTTDPEGDKPDEIEVEDLDQLYADQLESKESTLEKPLYIKINGKTHTIDNVDEMRNLMERGLNYTKKMQDLAKQRKELDSDRGDEELPVSTDTDTLASEILSSNYAEQFQSAASMLPDNVKSEMASDPSLLQGFYEDVQSGLAGKIMPKVERLMSVNNMSFEQAYFRAGSDINQQQPRGTEQKQMLRSQPKPTTSQLSTQKSVDDMSDKEFSKYFDAM